MTAKLVGIMAMVALPACAGAPPAAAQGPAAWATPWTRGAHGRVRLIAAATAVGTAPRLRFGLEFRLDPGWKIFWRTPGEAGLPPRLGWAGARNVAAVAVRWPRPVRFSEFGITSWGYRGHVVLPLVVTPARPGAPVTLAATLRYQICKDICILGEARLALSLPAGAAAPTPGAAAIARFARRVPVPFARSALARLSVAAIRAGGKPRLVVTVTGRRALPRGLRAIVEAPAGVRVAATAAKRVATARSVRLWYPVRSRPPGRKLAGVPVTVTVLGDGLAVERRTRIAAAP